MVGVIRATTELLIGKAIKGTEVPITTSLPMVQAMVEALLATTKTPVGEVIGEVVGEVVRDALVEAVEEMAKEAPTGTHEVSMTLAVASPEVGHVVCYFLWGPWVTTVGFMSPHLVIAKLPIHYLGDRSIAPPGVYK